MEANSLLVQLNDRNLNFPYRCRIAESLINPAVDNITWSFPRKNQYIFDWLTGSLIKLARTNPRPEIFLSKQVWTLLKSFSDILTSSQAKTLDAKVSLKRPFVSISNDDFFDYKRSFDPLSFTIKCPILTIFQTSLALLNAGEMDQFKMNPEDTLVESEMMCSVILAFVEQTRVSLPVSFSQVTEFIQALVQSRSNLSPNLFSQVLRLTLEILKEIIVGGAANYKKTYPMLVKFCLRSASGEEKDIWINFIQSCLFTQDHIEELLSFMTCPSMMKLLDSTDPLNESSFPKSLTFQRYLLIELSTDPLAIDSCPLIYEAFLRSSGSKLNRETGFNFFTFIFRKCLTLNNQKCNNQLAKLISVLQSRGNEIYQQRNDEIYREQSSIIEEIFSTAISQHPDEIPFHIILAIANLNYYLVSERLEMILGKINESESNDTIDFVVGIFELAALANQLPILLKTILDSNIPLTILKSKKLLNALVKIFRYSLSPFSLHQIYLSLIAEDSKKSASFLLLIPVMRSIIKVIDNIDSFDKELFMKFQSKLIGSENDDKLNLLAEIVRWTPGTILLVDLNCFSDVIPNSHAMMNLLFTLKCKRLVSNIAIENVNSIPCGYNLILKYLPLIAEDLRLKELKAFSCWLLENETECFVALSEPAFFEITSLRDPFLSELLSCIKENSKPVSFISKVIERIPWEYIGDETCAELIKCLWSSPSIVSQLLSTKIRKHTLNILKSHDEFINFLLNDASNSDLISKCFHVEHSISFVDKTLSKLESFSCPSRKAMIISKMIKYLNNCNEEVVVEEVFKFIDTKIGLLNLLQRKDLVSVETLDALDTILDWILENSENKDEFVAKCILNLSEFPTLEINVRCQALRCKFPSRNDLKFIEESIELASKLNPSEYGSVLNVFKKDLLYLIKGLSVENVKKLVESFIVTSDDEWRFSLGLRAINQFLNTPILVSTIFSVFQFNLDILYEKGIKFDMIPGLLASIKSVLSVKKNVVWESEFITNILGILRRVQQASPENYEETFSILRLIVSLHIRKFRGLLPLLIAIICESFWGIKTVEESGSLGRVLTELGSLKRTELESFSLLPILYAFISTKYSSSGVKKSLQLAMISLMYHLGSKKQLLQLLSTALITDQEDRLTLIAFVDEYNKFHKYSGRA